MIRSKVLGIGADRIGLEYGRGLFPVLQGEGGEGVVVVDVDPPQGEEQSLLVHCPPLVKV